MKLFLVKYKLTELHGPFFACRFSKFQNPENRQKRQINILKIDIFQFKVLNQNSKQPIVSKWSVEHILKV